MIPKAADEIECLERDGERYRWLRDSGGGDHAVVNGQLLTGERLDNCIDAWIFNAAPSQDAAQK